MKYLLAIITLLVLLISCNEHRANINESDSNLIKENNKIRIKDTVFSKSIINNIKQQALDNMGLDASRTVKKLEYYTPAFVIDYLLTKNTSLNKHQLLEQMVETMKKDKVLLNQSKKDGVKIEQWVNDSIRMFIVNDTLLFANFELLMKVTFNGHINESNRQIISISQKSGNHWQFIDKEGGREVLELQFGKLMSDNIINK